MGAQLPPEVVMALLTAMVLASVAVGCGAAVTAVLSQLG